MNGHNFAPASSDDSLHNPQRTKNLREAGQQYIDSVSQKLQQGRDPFIPAQPKTKAAAQADLEANQDADLEAVGQLITGSKLYVLCAFWLTGTATQTVFLKVVARPAQLLPCTKIRALSSTHLCLITLHSASCGMRMIMPSVSSLRVTCRQQ